MSKTTDMAMAQQEKEDAEFMVRWPVAPVSPASTAPLQPEPLPF